MCFCLIYSHTSYSQFSKVVIFGDSLSDTGNLASVTVSLPPPFYQNRISNGPVAVDRLTELLGTYAKASLEGGDNFAIAGGAILGDEIEDYNAQVNVFLNRVNYRADPDALYVIMLGGNDLRRIRGDSSSISADTKISAVVNDLRTHTQRLINAGAKQFLIANAPNIGRIPETISQNLQNPGVAARAQAYTQRFNQQSKVMLTAVASSSNSLIIQFDLYSAFEELIDNASSLGYTQTTVGCFQFITGSFHPDCVFGLRFDRFVFFDNLHPTSSTHQRLGEAMYAALLAGLAPEKRPVDISPIIMLLLNN